MEKANEIVHQKEREEKRKIWLERNLAERMSESEVHVHIVFANLLGYAEA